MEGLRRKYPSETIQAFLTLKPGQGGLAGWEKRFAGDVSDTLIFDFLIDGMNFNEKVYDDINNRLF